MSCHWNNEKLIFSLFRWKTLHIMFLKMYKYAHTFDIYLQNNSFFFLIKCLLCLTKRKYIVVSEDCSAQYLSWNWKWKFWCSSGCMSSYLSQSRTRQFRKQYCKATRETQLWVRDGSLVCSLTLTLDIAVWSLLYASTQSYSSLSLEICFQQPTAKTKRKTRPNCDNCTRIWCDVWKLSQCDVFKYFSFRNQSFVTWHCWWLGLSSGCAVFGPICLTFMFHNQYLEESTEVGSATKLLTSDAIIRCFYFFRRH